jgi:hypothetical protein
MFQFTYLNFISIALQNLNFACSSSKFRCNVVIAWLEGALGLNLWLEAALQDNDEVGWKKEPCSLSPNYWLHPVPTLSFCLALLCLWFFPTVLLSLEVQHSLCFYEVDGNEMNCSAQK